MIYKRKGEETVKQCENWTCQTAWKDSWLERYQDENECPVCGTEFSDTVTQLLPPIKNKPKDKVYYLRMRLIAFTEELEVNQCKAIALEGTNVFAGKLKAGVAIKSKYMHTLDDSNRRISIHIRSAQNKKLSQLRVRNVVLMNLIAEINGQMDKLKDISLTKGERNEFN